MDGLTSNSQTVKRLLFVDFRCQQNFWGEKFFFASPKKKFGDKIFCLPLGKPEMTSLKIDHGFDF